MKHKMWWIEKCYIVMMNQNKWKKLYFGVSGRTAKFARINQTINLDNILEINTSKVFMVPKGSLHF